MFTPRGVTKRLRAAVTGYYVLPQYYYKLLLSTGRRRSAAVLLLQFIFCLRSGRYHQSRQCTENNKR